MSRRGWRRSPTASSRRRCSRTAPRRPRPQRRRPWSMAQQGKRASMREGPLTALFSKTEEEQAEQEPEAVKEQPEAVAEEAQTTIPTPRERLRNVFSAEIPANMMERPGAE